MPELPEVETVRRTLTPFVRGRTLVDFNLSWDRTLGGMHRDEFWSRVQGRTVEGVSRRGKLILFELNDRGRVSVHLRMTGELLAIPPGDIADPTKDRFLRASFTLDNDCVIAFYDIRKFGRITYLAESDFERLNAALGIEPLSTEFTDERFFSILSSRSRAMKPLLLDQTVIAGLGNIYVDEALFASGVHPLTRSRDVTLEQARALRQAIVEILGSSIARHGTTLRNYRSGLGEQGGNQPYLRIYGLRHGSECAVCSSPVERIVVGQRGTVYCPTCQPTPAYASSIALPTSGSPGSRTG